MSEDIEEVLQEEPPSTFKGLIFFPLVGEEDWVGQLKKDPSEHLDKREGLILSTDDFITGTLVLTHIFEPEVKHKGLIFFPLVGEEDWVGQLAKSESPHLDTHKGLILSDFVEGEQVIEVITDVPIIHSGLILFPMVGEEDWKGQESGIVPPHLDTREGLILSEFIVGKISKDLANTNLIKHKGIIFAPLFGDKEPPFYCESITCLFKDKEGYKNLIGKLVSTETPEEEDFGKYGFNIRAIKDASRLMDKASIVIHVPKSMFKSKAKANYTPQPHLVKYLNTLPVDGLKKLLSMGIEGYDCKLLFSKDKGQTYYNYNKSSGAFEISSIEEVVSALDVTDVKSISSTAWANFLGKEADLFLIYYLPTGVSYTDKLSVMLQYLGYWKKAKKYDSEDGIGSYGYEYLAVNKLEIKLMSDGDYKINYIGRKV